MQARCLASVPSMIACWDDKMRLGSQASRSFSEETGHLASCAPVMMMMMMMMMMMSANRRKWQQDSHLLHCQRQPRRCHYHQHSIPRWWNVYNLLIYADEMSRTLSNMLMKCLKHSYLYKSNTRSSILMKCLKPSHLYWWHVWTLSSILMKCLQPSHLH